MKYPLYEKAKKLLYSEYHENFEIVKDSPYHKRYVNEKIRHSLQVSGAGNGILKHENYFQGRSEEFIDIARTAVLLHDIFRFQEIRILYESGKNVDHGVLGAEFLKQQTDFNNILITLPIKHHGHMIECLYEDEEYKNIKDEQLKEDVRHIAFAVRDADKIANWQLLTSEFDSVKEVWLPYFEDDSEAQSLLPPESWEFFVKQEVIPHVAIKTRTNAGEMLATLCWLFDINYQYSIFYCKKLNLLAKFLRLLKQVKVKDDKISIIQEVVKDYCKKKFDMDVL